MVEMSWPVSELMQEHLQNLMSLGYMTTTKLASYLVPEDPASPASVRGYVMTCVVFYD
jgi:hypothetical protein